MGRIRFAAVTASAIVTAAVTLAQEQPTFRVDVQLVRLLATVKDNYSKPVGGLAKEDFTVVDNGVPQDIAVFERHTEQPLSISGNRRSPAESDDTTGTGAKPDAAVRATAGTASPCDWLASRRLSSVARYSWSEFGMRPCVETITSPRGRNRRRSAKSASLPCTQPGEPCS